MDLGKQLDILNFFDDETSMKILLHLDDPSDLLRFSCASSSHQMVKNGVLKQLCLRMFPQLSEVVQVTKFMEKSKDAAGSKLNPTIHARDIFETLKSNYWSSPGQSDASVPETLTYQLVTPLCVVTEINIKPYKGYSPSAVRFRVGYAKPDSYKTVDTLGYNLSDDHIFVWNFTTPEFPMTQENRMQNFKLPEPVLCIGGFFQIELLGRVKRHPNDGLFYMGVSHVHILGQALLTFSRSCCYKSALCNLPDEPKDDLLDIDGPLNASREFRRIWNMFPLPDDTHYNDGLF
ncbi:hypothetical protein ACFE04_026449 [Oxalis oulophora]